MKRLLMSLTLIVVSQPVFALLPPYYQSVKEMVAILNSPLVAEKMGSPYSIQSLIKSETGYTLAVGECKLDIKINYIQRKDGLVGPAEFNIEPGEKNCNTK